MVKTFVRVLLGLGLVVAFPMGIMQVLCVLEGRSLSALLEPYPYIFSVVTPLLPFIWPFLFHLVAGVLLCVVLRPQRNYLMVMNSKASGIVLWVTFAIFLGLCVSKVFLSPVDLWWADWLKVWGIDSTSPTVLMQAGTVIVFTVVFVPFAEELFYRVVLFHSYKNILSPYGALVVTSLIFSMVHCFSVSGGQCQVNPWNLGGMSVCLPLGPLVLGLLSQLIWIREQSFRKIWIFHGLCNGMAMFYF